MNEDYGDFGIELLNRTCSLKLIFSCGNFLVRFDKNDKGKTKAALPTKTNPSRAALTEIDVFGLQKKIQK